MEEAKDKTTRGLAKFYEGSVTSSKMNKTVVVTVSRKVKHRSYGKYILRSKKYAAHDEQNECALGDLVRIVGSRPLSKTKRWRVESILRRAV